MSELQSLERQGLIDLFYGDQSGFCLTPVIPYGWQFAEERLSIRPLRSQRLNVLGLLNQANQLFSFERQGTINTEFVVASINEWSTNIKKPTVLVLDNAPIHHGQLFKNQLPLWQERNLFIFFLPAYSPHLNKIETLWRKIKYEWLKPEDYRSFLTLKEAIHNVLTQFGQKYKIDFATSFNPKL